MFNEILESFTADELKQRLRLIPADGPRPTRKADMIAAIRRYLSASGCRETWQHLEPDEQAVIAETVHNGSGRFDGGRFLAKYGAVPAVLQPARHQGHGRTVSDRKNYLALLLYRDTIPPELCRLLTEFVPIPAEERMKTVAADAIPDRMTGSAPHGLDDKDHGPVRRLETEAVVRQDLAALLRLVASGRFAVSEKTGLPGAATLRKIDALLAGGDYYPPEDDWQLESWAGSPVRPIRPFIWPLLLQTGGLAKPRGKVLELTRKGKAALQAPFERTIRDLYIRWRDKGARDEFRRIEQVKGQGAKSRPMASVAERRQAIEDTLLESPIGKWVEVAEWYRHALSRGQGFQVARDVWKLYLVDANYGTLGYAPSSLLDVTYLKAYCMEVLATLGLLDIAYVHPYFGPQYTGGLWGTEDLLYLSRYDGLLYVRLNPLGAYCLGLQEDYTPRAEASSSLFELDATQHIHLLRPPQAADEMLLDQFAERIDTDRWQVTLGSLLEAIADGLEPDEFHRFLQLNAAADLPDPVDGLFENVAARRSALADAGPARLLRCATVALAEALAADPATAAHCLHAGGKLLVVPAKRIKRFRTAVAKIGYILPPSIQDQARPLGRGQPARARHPDEESGPQTKS